MLYSSGEGIDVQNSDLLGKVGRALVMCMSRQRNSLWVHLGGGFVSMHVVPREWKIFVWGGRAVRAPAQSQKNSARLRGGGLSPLRRAQSARDCTVVQVLCLRRVREENNVAQADR